MVTRKDIKDPLMGLIEFMKESNIEFTIEDSFPVMSVNENTGFDIDVEELSQHHFYNESDVYSCDCFAERHPIFS